MSNCDIGEEVTFSVTAADLSNISPIQIVFFFFNIPQYVQTLLHLTKASLDNYVENCIFKSISLIDVY